TSPAMSRGGASALFEAIRESPAVLLRFGLLDAEHDEVGVCRFWIYAHGRHVSTLPRFRVGDLSLRVVNVNGHLRGILVTAEPEPVAVAREELVLHDARLLDAERTCPKFLPDKVAVLHCGV